MYKERCFGAGKEFYADYHDREWGVPVHEDRRLFEMLILEGAQAGLSWETVLKRRNGYRKAFHDFDPVRVAAMSDTELEHLLQNPEIIRNRLKVYGARQNAQAFLQIQREFGSFDRYVWSFVNGTPIKNHWKAFRDIPTTTPESDALSKDLKKRGMTFVGSTIMYAFMQAIGMVNDHTAKCWLYASNGHSTPPSSPAKSVTPQGTPPPTDKEYRKVDYVRRSGTSPTQDFAQLLQDVRLGVE